MNYLTLKGLTLECVLAGRGSFGECSEYDSALILCYESLVLLVVLDTVVDFVMIFVDYFFYERMRVQRTHLSGEIASAKVCDSKRFFSSFVYRVVHYGSRDLSLWLLMEKKVYAVAFVMFAVCGATNPPRITSGVTTKKNVMLVFGL